MSITLIHSDGCSGTTITPDNTKVYWTEGRSEAVIVYANGKMERVPAQSDHPVLKSKEIHNVQTDHNREMTVAEEIEWQVAMMMPI